MRGLAALRRAHVLGAVCDRTQFKTLAPVALFMRARACSAEQCARTGAYTAFRRRCPRVGARARGAIGCCGRASTKHAPISVCAHARRMPPVTPEHVPADSLIGRPVLPSSTAPRSPPSRLPLARPHAKDGPDRATACTTTSPTTTPPRRPPPHPCPLNSAISHPPPLRSSSSASLL